MSIWGSVFDCPPLWNREINILFPLCSYMICFCRQKGTGVIPTSTKIHSSFHPPAIGKSWRCYLTSSPFYCLLYHHIITNCLLTLMVSGNFLNHSFWIVTLFSRFFVITFPSIQRFLLSLPCLALKQKEREVSQWLGLCKAKLEH